MKNLPLVKSQWLKTNWHFYLFEQCYVDEYVDRFDTFISEIVHENPNSTQFIDVLLFATKFEGLEEKNKTRIEKENELFQSWQETVYQEVNE